MGEFENQYIKRTQKDCSLTFKLSVFQEVENGELSIQGGFLKYDI